MSSRPNPLHLSSCYCYGYRFWGGPIAFQRFVEVSISEIQHEAKIIQNPLQNRLGNRLRSCFVGFRCFGNTSCSFHFAFIWERERERKKKERKKERQREREREKEGEREKESERVGCQNDMVTAGNKATGWISLIGFARFQQYLLRLRQVNGLSCMVIGYGFWGGPIALQYFVHISDKKLLQC